MKGRGRKNDTGERLTTAFKGLVSGHYVQKRKWYFLIQRVGKACQEPWKTNWFAHCHDCHAPFLLFWFNSDHVKLQQPTHQLCILGISVNSAGKSQVIPHLRAETVSFQMAACMQVFVFSDPIEPLLLCPMGDAFFLSTALLTSQHTKLDYRSFPTYDRVFDFRMRWRNCALNFYFFHFFSMLEGSVMILLKLGREIICRPGSHSMMRKNCQFSAVQYGAKLWRSLH